MCDLDNLFFKPNACFEYPESFYVVENTCEPCTEYVDDIFIMSDQCPITDFTVNTTHPSQGVLAYRIPPVTPTLVNLQSMDPAALMIANAILELFNEGALPGVDLSSSDSCTSKCVLYSLILGNKLKEKGIETELVNAERHSFLVYGDLIIDPSIYQFFDDPSMQGIFIGDSQILSETVQNHYITFDLLFKPEDVCHIGISYFSCTKDPEIFLQEYWGIEGNYITLPLA